jgi:hypothetical protein
MGHHAVDIALSATRRHSDLSYLQGYKARICSAPKSMRPAVRTRFFSRAAVHGLTPYMEMLCQEQHTSLSCMLMAHQTLCTVVR